MLNEITAQAYTKILQEELLTATGCTEPIAIAYAAARAKALLGCMPQNVKICVSRNIIKNAKSVTVPRTGGLRGIKAAAAAGIIAGSPEKKLQVLEGVMPEHLKLIEQLSESEDIKVCELHSNNTLDIIVSMNSGEDSCAVQISGGHTNIVYEEKNGKMLTDKRGCYDEEYDDDKSLLNIADIFKYAAKADLSVIKPLIQKQINYNCSIAEEGLKNKYGASVGMIMSKLESSSIKSFVSCAAAAASDARMNGCDMPVVILCGSGNQGITASVPVAEYGKKAGKSQEAVIRAVILSDLITVYQKSGIGKLSAFCGAISAGCGAGAGIAFLTGGGLKGVEKAIINTLGISSGIVCDGAKSSCAGKIALAVEAGLLGFEMSREEICFEHGDGIVAGSAEATIKNINTIAKKGMRETDDVIIEIMLSNA